MRDRILNIALYQAGWFAMVLGATSRHPWEGSAAGLALISVHLFLARERLPEIKTVVTIGILGTAIDSVQAFAGVFVFESGYWTYWLVPFWLTVMWMQFATLFNFALSWMSGRYLLSAILGALGGPAAYYTGDRLGAVIFPMGTAHSVFIMAAVWFFLTPLCVFIAAGFRPVPGSGTYRLRSKTA